MKNTARISMVLATATAFGVLGTQAWARPLSATSSAPEERTTHEPARASLKLELKLDPTAHGLYVGQAVPVTIHAYFLGGTGVTVNGQPRMMSDALLLSDLSTEPRQSSVQTHGLPYTALTWTGALTAVKAGEMKTEIDLPVVLTYREAPRMRSWRVLGQAGQSSDVGDSNGDNEQDEAGAGDPFASLLRQSPFASDPLFAQMFNGRSLRWGVFDDLAGAVRRRDVTLRDPGGSMNVADPPLPRPPEFSGAVGTFDISAALSDETFRVGEPSSLKLTVRGKGSFSRLSVPGLPSTDELNTYGVTSAFTPEPSPLAGAKVFTQTIAPRRAGELTIPSSALTYFDPRARRYVTRRTTPLRISVAAAAGGNDVVATPPPVAPADTRPGGPSLADVAVPDIVRSTLAPSFRTGKFWGLAAATGLVGIALAILGWTYRKGALGRMVATRRVRREIAAQRRNIAAAAALGDAATLFGAGRKALQARLGAAWGIPADAIATADVVSRLGPRGEGIRDVFEHADRLTYAGGATAKPREDPRDQRDLNDWQRLILDELRTLQART
jgi:hypothetical protein